MKNELFDKARAIAIKAHGEQLYGEKPYEHHLQMVGEILRRFGFHSENDDHFPLLISAWLHDSLEDTDLTKAEIEAVFGNEVADLVWRVTDEDGANRKERKAKTYLKLRESEQAIILKLADRIANVESSLQNNPGLLRMYAKEQFHFSESLKPFSQSEKSFKMWEHLEKLFAST